MNFEDYQRRARVTAIYKKEIQVIYPTLGLVGEAGEVANKVKNVKRIAESTAGQLINIRDSVATHSSEIDAGDITKLNAVKTDMNTAITALNAVAAEVDTQFPNVE